MRGDFYGVGIDFLFFLLTRIVGGTVLYITLGTIGQTDSLPVCLVMVGIVIAATFTLVVVIGHALGTELYKVANVSGDIVVGDVDGILVALERPFWFALIASQ